MLLLLLLLVAVLLGFVTFFVLFCDVLLRCLDSLYFILFRFVSLSFALLRFAMFAFDVALHKIE